MGRWTIGDGATGNRLPYDDNSFDVIFFQEPYPRAHTHMSICTHAATHACMHACMHARTCTCARHGTARTPRHGTARGGTGRGYWDGAGELGHNCNGMGQESYGGGRRVTPSTRRTSARLRANSSACCGEAASSLGSTGCQRRGSVKPSTATGSDQSTSRGKPRPVVPMARLYTGRRRRLYVGRR